MNKLELKQKRREFLSSLILISLFFITLSSKKLISNKSEEELNINKKLLNKINSYNSTRLIELNSKLKDEIKSDLLNERTIWKGKKLYTYAECYIYF